MKYNQVYKKVGGDHKTVLRHNIDKILEDHQNMTDEETRKNAAVLLMVLFRRLIRNVTKERVRKGK